MNSIIRFAVDLAWRRSIREQVRLRGLKAVRGYISTVGKVRLGAMAFIGLIAGVSLFVAGIVLTVGALIAMIPMSEAALRWTTLVIGLVLVLIGGVAFGFAFSQRRWLEVSRSYELMGALIDPVPSALSVAKNLVRAVKREPTVHVPRASIQPPIVRRELPPRLEPRHV